MRVFGWIIVVALLLIPLAVAAQESELPAGDEALGTKKYDQYEMPKTCGACHTDFFRQWEQAMMSQAYTHHWDEIEYFELAIPHADKDEMVAGVKAGCNGCHAPVSFFGRRCPAATPRGELARE